MFEGKQSKRKDGRIQEGPMNKLTCATRTHPKKREEIVPVRDSAILQPQINESVPGVVQYVWVDARIEG